MGESNEVVLARIEERLTQHCDNQETWQDTTTGTIKTLGESMDSRVGEVVGVQNSHNVRIDRIEQREKGRARLMWIAVTAAFSSLGLWIKSRF